MNQTRDILRAVEAGELSADDALSRLKLKPFENLGYAQVDLHREVMQGASEVIYGAGKTAEQIAGIARTMLDHGRTRILVTRLSAAQAEAVADQVPLTFDEVSHLGRIGALPEPDGLGNVLVVTGGTSDIPVAEEAAQTAEFLGNRVQRAYDMGYGASFGGVSALLSMLNSCASGVAVVNIDNGFGAGYMASMINHMDVKGGHAVVEATHVDTECGGLR